MHGDADADTEQQFVIVNVKRCIELLDDGRRHGQGIGGEAEATQQYDEFIAAQTPHRVFCAQAIAKSRRGLNEQFVPGFVAQGVVDLFKVVQIQE